MVLEYVRETLARAGIRPEAAETVNMRALLEAFPANSLERDRLDDALAWLSRSEHLSPALNEESHLWSIRSAGRAQLLSLEQTSRHIAGDVLGTWTVGCYLGRGGQGTTYFVRRTKDIATSPEWYVLKLAHPWHPATSKSPTEEVHRARFIREVNTMEFLAAEGCPNIVPLVDKAVDVGSYQPPWYVMPYYPLPLRRDLPDGTTEYAERYTGDLDRVLDIAIEVATTLSFMHERGAVHRDLHSGNILMAKRQGIPLVADLGLVHTTQRASATLVTGSTEALGAWRVRPPELTAGGENRHEPLSDVFMLGALIYELLLGHDPPERLEHPRGRFKHEEGPLAIARTLTGDARVPALNRLLRYMLADDLRERRSAAEVLQALRSIRRMSKAESPTEDSWLPPGDELSALANTARETSEAKAVAAQHDMLQLCEAAKRRLEPARGLQRDGFRVGFASLDTHWRGSEEAIMKAAGRWEAFAMLEVFSDFAGPPRVQVANVAYCLVYREGEVALVRCLPQATLAFLCELVRPRSFMGDPGIVEDMIRRASADAPDLLNQVKERVRCALQPR